VPELLCNGTSINPCENTRLESKRKITIMFILFIKVFIIITWFGQLKYLKATKVFYFYQL